MIFILLDDPILLHTSREEYKIRCIDDLYFQTWDHTLELLIASLQLRNSDESHRVEIVNACRRSSYKTSELHFEISLRRFSFHRSPSSYRKEGKKFKRKSIRRNPTRFGNPANSFRFSRPILIAALSREEHCSENTGEIFEISVISMSQNSRSSARKSLDSVRGITNGVHGDHVARIKRERKKASMVVGSNLTYGTSTSAPST